ncbi:MAG: hypothetical protein CBB80_011190 [Synechococcus sp. TMED20]|nr:MAG: hypothetical protein CBB80_011190 [Synechococcus sp. TMED20]
MFTPGSRDLVSAKDLMTGLNISKKELHRLLNANVFKQGTAWVKRGSGSSRTHRSFDYDVCKAAYLLNQIQIVQAQRETKMEAYDEQELKRLSSEQH